MSEDRKLGDSYFQNPDVVHLAADLLGKNLYTLIDGELCSGIIVETEAYRGPEDTGSHAYGGRCTTRNASMYKAGGIIYMYVCYGIHDMLNIVTGEEGSSHAILIRAAQPSHGIDIMRERRQVFNDDRRLCKGPGSLARAFGLNKQHDGESLSATLVWIEDSGWKPQAGEVLSAPRVGLNIGEPFRSIRWRFYLSNNPYVSVKSKDAVPL